MTKQKIQSPVGVFKYTTVTGQGKENYEGDGYIYQCLVDIDKDAAQDYIADIEDFLEDNAPKGAKLVDSRPYSTHEDHDSIPTDKVRFTFKTNTEFEDKITGEISKTTVHILDSTGTICKLPEDVLIGNGTTGIAFGTMFVYNRGSKRKLECGVSLALNKIQIKDFIPYEGEKVEPIQEGSFTGFDKTLQKDEDEDEKTRRRRRRK